MSSTRKFDLRYINGDTAATMTSAGTTQGTAATITAANVLVTTHTAGAGVILDAHEPGFVYRVCNASANNDLKVYPPSRASFNGLTANDPQTLSSGSAATFVSLTSTKYMALAGA